MSVLDAGIYLFNFQYFSFNLDSGDSHTHTALRKFLNFLFQTTTTADFMLTMRI